MEISILLDENFPNIDPKTISFVKLRELVLTLEEFEEGQTQCGERGAAGPSSTIRRTFECLFVPIHLPDEFVVSNVMAAKTEIDVRTESDSIPCTTRQVQRVHPIHPSASDHQADAALFTPMRQINCVPRRAQGFHASWKDFTMRMEISFAHPKEDFVYGAAWRPRTRARTTRTCA